MDQTTIIGIISGIGLILLGFMMEGGSPLGVVELSAFIIVMGGSAGATITGYSMGEIKELPKVIRNAFIFKETDPQKTIEELVYLADKARHEGLLVLEDAVRKSEDEFLKKGVQLVVDGNDADLIRTVLETDIDFEEERHEMGAGIFEAIGGFAPTMGILGTVLALVHALENMDDPAAMGPAIATAFVATLYGVGIANLIFLPIGSKLKRRSAQERLLRDLVLEGILSIQAGSNPRLVESKLHAFLSPKQRRPVVDQMKGR